jgi:hypothetical protein
MDHDAPCESACLHTVRHGTRGTATDRMILIYSNIFIACRRQQQQQQQQRRQQQQQEQQQQEQQQQVQQEQEQQREQEQEQEQQQQQQQQQEQERRRRGAQMSDLTLRASSEKQITAVFQLKQFIFQAFKFFKFLDAGREAVCVLIQMLSWPGGVQIILHRGKFELSLFVAAVYCAYHSYCLQCCRNQ